MLTIHSLLFLVLPLFGWVVLRTLLGVNNLVYLLPFSFVSGLSFFLVLIYSFAYFFGIKTAALLSLFGLFIIATSLFLFFKKDFFKIENPFKLPEISILFFICFFISFFTYLLTEKWIILDFHFHLSFASYFFKTGKFPQAVPNWPTLFIPYHFAFDLLSATLAKVTNISVMSAFRLIAIVSSITTFLSAYAIAYYFLTNLLPVKDKQRSTNQALWGAAFFYFSGNLLWLDALVRFLLTIPPVQENWSLLKTMCALGMHGSIMNDMASAGIIFPSATLGIQLFLLLLFLFFQFMGNDLQQNKKITLLDFKYIVCILLTALSLFHTSEYILYLFILALLLSPLLLVVLRDVADLKKISIKYLICFFFLLLIVFLNGQAYKILSKNYTYFPTFLELTTNPNLFSLEVFGRYGDLNKHRIISLFSWDFISEFGFQLIFSIGVLYWLIKIKFKNAGFILSFFFVSFFSPFLLYLKSSPAEVVRMFHPAFELLSLLFALWLCEIRNKFNFFLLRQFLLIFSFVVILPSISTLVLSGLFSPGIYLDHPLINYVDYSLNEYKKDNDSGKFFKNVNSFVNLLKRVEIINEADIEVASFLKEHSQDNEYGISLHPQPFDYIGLPCYSIRGSTLARRISFLTLLRTLDPGLLKELKIRWLFIDVQTAKLLDLALAEELISKGFLKEALAVQYPGYKDLKFRLFEFVDLPKYMSTYPRKTFWTIVRYFGSTVIALPGSTGKQTIFLFKTEQEATNFLKEQMKTNSNLKESKPFIDAVSEEILKQQANQSGFSLSYQ